MKLTGIMLFVFSLALAAIVFTLAAMTLQLDVLIAFTEDLRQQLDLVAPVSAVEPYGGCDEAASYPNTPGWKWCRDRGYLD